MNRLVEHISFLLFENDFIIVPGLGGFVVNKEQAYSDDAKQILHAPHHWIGFNQALTHNDGLLVELYIKTQATSSLKAEQMIKEDVEDLRKELFASKWIDLGNWGKLYLNKEGSVCFNNSNGTNFVKPEFWGLESISIRSLADIRAENEKETESKRYSPLRKAIAFTSASAAAAILLFAISIPISDRRESNKQFAGFFPEKITSADHVILRNADSLEGVPAKRLPQDKDMPTSKEPEYQSKLTKEAKYFLIVGTFQTMTVANKELESFRQKGFDDSGIIANSNAKRIFVARFSDATEANTYLSKFVTENPLLKDAWIYSLKETDKFPDTTTN
ncbi:MAG: hypothetical protein BGN96_09365 [Bacteroidales bacterium 45-6]|nr:MAG: hypothetical protein BGN96_09365 [Bacteroidales bacterium 45-6]